MKTLITTALLLVLYLQNAAAQKDTFHVYFDFGTSQLSDAGIRTIDSIIYHQALPVAQAISLIGYADSIGTDPSNMKLSKARAEAVQQYLVQSGFKRGTIQLVIGRGEVKDQRSNQVLDRKVDIVSEKSGPAKAIPKNDKEVAPATNKPKRIETIRLKNLFFKEGDELLLPQSAPELEKLYKLVNDNPALEIRVEGHTCCIPKKGSEDDQNQAQSARQAEAVYEYLISRGIDKARLGYIGFGAKRPLIFPERSLEDHQTNRRIEVRITEK